MHRWARTTEWIRSSRLPRTLPPLLVSPVAAPNFSKQQYSRNLLGGTRRVGAIAAAVSPPEQALREARLRYVCDDDAGFARRRSGRGFAYYDANGGLVSDRGLREWFRQLAIPPAWTDVWISPVRNGHILATGRDVKGRKQYIYHPRWQQVRRESNFHCLLGFGRALPALRERISADMRRPGLPRERVVALVVHLLQSTLIRVGNPEYVQQNDSYGLTTLTVDHLQLSGSTLRFQFRGKGGHWHELDLRDARAARAVRRCQELPGQRLFQYLDAEGVGHDVGSEDVNEYLRACTGEEFTAKVIRTWGGSAAAIRVLLGLPRASSAAEAERHIKVALRGSAQCLRNTLAVCRQHYVHPRIAEAYRDSALWRRCHLRANSRPRNGLSEEETFLLTLLEEAAAGEP
jgi:DNA topoisomerase I